MNNAILTAKLLALVEGKETPESWLSWWSRYLDIEHEEFNPLAKWNDFIADPGRYLNGMIEGDFAEQGE